MSQEWREHARRVIVQHACSLSAPHFGGSLTSFLRPALSLLPWATIEVAASRRDGVAGLRVRASEKRRRGLREEIRFFSESGRDN
jgi:hypothetical protein